MHKKHKFTPRSYCLTATMLLSSYFLLTYTRSLHCAILGKIIGTIPEECAADAISMVKARNKEQEEKEKEKENQVLLQKTIEEILIRQIFIPKVQ